MSDYDQRQYKLMLELLKAFDKRSLGLRKLIADLEALLVCLQDTDEEWKESFHKQWGRLEDVYADALDKGYKQLPQDDQTRVEDAIYHLQQLVQKRIDSEL
jgi:hypothetical protein